MVYKFFKNFSNVFEAFMFKLLEAEDYFCYSWILDELMIGVIYLPTISFVVYFIMLNRLYEFVFVKSSEYLVPLIEIDVVARDF